MKISRKKIRHFLQKGFGEKIFVQKFLILVEKQLILEDFGKIIKKNLPKWKIWVGCTRKTVFFFLFFFFFFVALPLDEQSPHNHCPVPAQWLHGEIGGIASYWWSRQARHACIDQARCTAKAKFTCCLGHCLPADGLSPCLGASGVRFWLTLGMRL